MRTIIGVKKSLIPTLSEHSLYIAAVLGMRLEFGQLRESFGVDEGMLLLKGRSNNPRY